MKAKKSLRIFVIAALISGAFFVPPARASLTLPTTPCDAAEKNYLLVSNMPQEDGTKAFQYGANNNFVSKSGNVVTFNVNLLFTPQPKSSIRFDFLNSSCTAVAGSGFGIDYLTTNNVYSLDTNTYNYKLNNLISGQIKPNGIVRYIYVSVFDAYPGPTVTSYSYGIDVTNIQNPGGSAPPPSEPPGKRPVVIIPGIAGSELYDGSNLIWPNISQMYKDIGDQFLTDSLSMDSSGNSVKSISVGNTIKEQKLVLSGLTVFDLDIFQSLQALLESNGYSSGQNYFFFPYDWRLDNSINVDKLKQKIEDIKTQTGFKKVDIVAHSMGGLLAKDYISQNGKDSVNKLIFVGTPHLGAPKAGKILLEGDDMGIPWLEEQRIKEISQNSPAVYELLPDQKYFDTFVGYLRQIGIGTDALNYSDTKNFLLNHGANQSIYNIADNFSAKHLEDLDLSGLQTYNIAGCKVSTQARYEYSSGGGQRIFNIDYTSGDGTVPLVSSDYSSATNKYYVKGISHAELPSADGVRQLIVGLLGGNEVLSSNTSHSKDFCNFKGKELSWHSPVTVHVYDSAGRHTGPIDGGIEKNIPGVDYEIIDGEKFIFLPTDSGETYSVVGTGETTGTFDLMVTDVDNGTSSQTTVFNDVPIVTNTSINLPVSDSTTDSTINVDSQTVSANSVLSGTAQSDFTAPVTTNSVNGTAGTSGWYISNVQVNLNATDDNSGVLVTRYSLDNGATFTDYSGPVTVSTEGVTNIKYYSVDKAGNDEPVQSLQIKIDKTPPEISSYFDYTKNQFVFTSTDSISCTSNSCLASDLAGNQTSYLFDTQPVKLGYKQTLKSVAYSQGSPIVFISTTFTVATNYDQSFMVKGIERMKINYDSRRNQSTVTTNISGVSSKAVYPGLKILQITTNQGTINLGVK